MTDRANNFSASSFESPGTSAKPTCDSRAGPAPRPCFRRRILVRGSVGIALLAVSVAGYLYFQWHATEQGLADAIAEADRLDPGWRLPDLEGKRAVVPAEKNAGVFVNKAGTAWLAILRMKNNHRDLGKIHEELEKVAPHVRLTQRQTADLRAALEPLAALLANVGEIAGRPTGRYPVDTSPTFYSPVPHVDDASILALVLLNAGALQIQDGDTDAAWVSCRALLNVARSFGDEPVKISQLIRASRCRDAIRLMERTLAHAHVPANELARVQMLLEEEYAHPRLLITLRAERAFCHAMLTQVEAGKISTSELARALDRDYGPKGFLADMRGYLARPSIKPAHAWLLRYWNQAVEIAKRPDGDPEFALRKLQATAAEAPPLARQILPDPPRFDMFANLNNGRALSACAFTAMAAERYRLRHERWPERLDDLVAVKLLAEVPADPYDGKPLGYRSTKDGVVIYSVGKNGAGDGAALEVNPPDLTDTRLEFRLWDGHKR